MNAFLIVCLLLDLLWLLLVSTRLTHLCPSFFLPWIFYMSFFCRLSGVVRILSGILYFLTPCTRLSCKASVPNTVLPGHNTYGQEEQQVHHCRGQYETQFQVRQAVRGVVHRLSPNELVPFSSWQVPGMLRSCVSEIPRLFANEPSSLLPIGREYPIFHGVGSMPCAMFR